MNITTGNRLDVVVEDGKVTGLWHWPDSGERTFIPVGNPQGLLAILQHTLIEQGRTEPHDFALYVGAYNACTTCWLPKEAHDGNR